MEKTKTELSDLITDNPNDGFVFKKNEIEYKDWPVESRISHRIILYAAQRKPNPMNQYTIEDIVREELSRK